MDQYGHFINGARVSGGSGRSSEVFNPSTGEVKAQVALASVDEMNQAVASAAAAQAEWAHVNPQRRARVMFKFKSLVEADADNLARLLSEEHGKVIADSPSLREIQAYAKRQRESVPESCRAIDSPDSYPVGLELRLADQKRAMIEEATVGQES